MYGYLVLKLQVKRAERFVAWHISALRPRHQIWKLCILIDLAPILRIEDARRYPTILKVEPHSLATASAEILDYCFGHFVEWTVQ